MTLTSKQRKHLEALAHELEPVVRIGKGGITPTVLKTTAEALQARELIKVKILENSELEKDEAAEKLMSGASCELVRLIGRILVLYRPNPEKKHPIEFTAPVKEEVAEGDEPAKAKTPPKKKWRPSPTSRLSATRKQAASRKTGPTRKRSPQQRRGR